MLYEVGYLVKLDSLLTFPRFAVTDNHIWFQIPVQWADALVNNDETRLGKVTPKELEAFKQFMYHYVETGNVLSVGQSPYFSKHHDARPYGVLPCDVIDVKIGYDYDPC